MSALWERMHGYPNSNLPDVAPPVCSDVPDVAPPVCSEVPDVAPPVYSKVPDVPLYSAAYDMQDFPPVYVEQLPAYAEAPVQNDAMTQIQTLDIEVAIYSLTEQLHAIWSVAHQQWHSHLKNGKDWRDIITRIQHQVKLIQKYELIIGFHPQLYWFYTLACNTTPEFTLRGQISLITNKRVYTMKLSLNRGFNGTCNTNCTELIQSPVYQFDESFGKAEIAFLRRLMKPTEIQQIQQRHGMDIAQDRANDAAVKMFDTQFESFMTTYTTFPGTVLQPLPKYWIEVLQPNGHYLYVNTNTFETTTCRP
jgi:hypothetical protein